jgi:large-conductance mechanosensitive channel
LPTGENYEHDDLAIKGNAVGMTAGMLIRATFGKIVSSFVYDVIIATNRITNWGGRFQQTYFHFKINIRGCCCCNDILWYIYTDSN